MKVSKKGGGNGVGEGSGVAVLTAVAVCVGVVVFSGVCVRVGVREISGVIVAVAVDVYFLVGVYRCTMFAPELVPVLFNSWQPEKTKQATIRIRRGNAYLRWNILKVFQTNSILVEISGFSLT
jgi:hypothetical protein